jgi:hypothetical protein
VAPNQEESTADKQSLDQIHEEIGVLEIRADDSIRIPFFGSIWRLGAIFIVLKKTLY